MKKAGITLIALIATGLLSIAVAQESDMDSRRFRFGLSAAPNLGWVRPTIPDLQKSGLQSRMGFGYGLMIDYKFSDSPNYLFTTGVNLTTNGGGMVEPWDSLDIGADTNYFYGKLDRTYRLQYVNIPLLLKMRTNEIGYMTYFGAIGFDLGIRTRAFANDEFDWVQTGLTPANEKDNNIQQNINLFRLGINVTLGGEYNLSGNTNAYVGIGWHNAFTNMFRNSPTNMMLKPDSEGNPVLDNGIAVPGKNKKAVTNYVSLNLGIYF